MKVAGNQAILRHVPLGDTVAQQQKKKEKNVTNIIKNKGSSRVPCLF